MTTAEFKIRRVSREDIGRLAEIIVFNNRVNYYPIFKDVRYSFKEFTVLNVCEQFDKDPEFLDNCWIYEDEVIKGFIYVVNGEIKKLYVDSFFQSQGVGSALLEFAVKELGARYLWALEKNVRAVKFYEAHGFRANGERCYEEGTTEWLVKMEKVE